MWGFMVALIVTLFAASLVYSEKLVELIERIERRLRGDN